MPRKPGWQRQKPAKVGFLSLIDGAKEIYDWGKNIPVLNLDRKTVPDKKTIQLIERIVEYVPGFLEDLTILKQTIEGGTLAEKKSAWAVLRSKVLTLQSICGHQGRIRVLRFDINYSPLSFSGFSNPGDFVFEGERCDRCMLFLQRPEGPPWQICHKCGGEMKDVFCLVRPKGITVAKCWICGHEYERGGALIIRT